MIHDFGHRKLRSKFQRVHGNVILLVITRLAQVHFQKRKYFGMNVGNYTRKMLMMPFQYC